MLPPWPLVGSQSDHLRAGPQYSIVYIRGESPAEPRREIEVRWPDELVDRDHPLDAEPAADQPGGVTREGGGVAGDSDDGPYRGGSERLGLPGCTGARRIEHRRSVPG